MPGLREIQERFSACVLDAEATRILDDVRAGEFEAGSRLQVYRNSVFTGFSDALGAVYPVVEKLVGEDFFRYACREFIRCSQSRSGDLHDYGHDFSEFLASFEPALHLAYLPDVARLEWLFHRVYHEADADGMDLEALGRVAPDRHERLVFQLNPASRLMRSGFPVSEIWRVNQDDYDEEPIVDLDAGGVNLLVLRRGEEVEMHPVAAGDFEMLTAIAAGEALGDCVAAVEEIESDFDLAEFLSRYVGNRTLISFTLR